MLSPKKVVLAYSGGLDTSIILKWLELEYGCEVITFTADLGQGEELEPAREKAILLGIKPENIFIEDLREEFVRDFVFPMFRANPAWSLGIVVDGLELNGRKDCSNISSLPASLNNLSAMSVWSGFASATNCFA